MKLDTIVRRFTRRKFAPIINSGPNAINYGVACFDPDTNTINVDVEQLYADFVLDMPYNSINFSNDSIKNEIDFLADKVEDYLFQLLKQKATQELLERIDCTVRQIAVSVKHEIFDNRAVKKHNELIKEVGRYIH